MDSAKKLLVLGSGGHGWESIKYAIDSFDGEVIISMLPVDWGGSTGTIGRLLKIQNGELNKILHNDKNYPVLPFGDLNKFIAAYIEDKCDSRVRIKDKHDTVNCLEFRSDSYAALMRVFICLISCLGLEKDIAMQFESYVKTYLEYYLEYKEMLSNPKTTSFGNLWHSFLFYQCNGLDGLVSFYKSKRVLPQNFHILFTSDNRQILQGVYQNEENNSFELDGEDLIDDSDYPIDPDSFKLVTITRQQKLVTNNFVKTLKEASIVIIPNGSLANWLPLVNNQEILKILEKKSEKNELIWIMNLFHSKNEYPFDIYYHYLSTLGIHPIILGPVTIPAEYYVSFLKDYQKEGKTLNYNFNTQAHNGENLTRGFNNCLEVLTHLENRDIEGVKYDKECIKKIITEFNQK